MRQRLGWVVVLTASIFLPSQLRAAAPSLTVQLRSIDELLENVKYVVAQTGRAEQARQIEGFINAWLGKDGIAGIDTHRPLGFYGIVSTKAIIGLIPVANEKALLGLLENFNIKATRGGEGIYSISADNAPVTLYLRFSGGYAYVTAPDKKALAQENIIDAAQVLSKSDQALLSAVVHLDQIPDDLKRIGLQQMDAQLKEEINKNQPGESPAQRNLRIETLQTISRQITSLVKDGQRLTVAFNIDRQAGDITAEASFGGTSGSDLAKTISQLGQGRSGFAGLLKQDAAIGGLVQLALPVNLQSALGPVIDEGFRQGLVKEKDAARRKQSEKFLNALLPTLKAGELDAGFRISGPSGGQNYDLIMGFKIKDGNAIEKELRALLQTLAPRDRALFQLDAAKAGALAIHRIDINKSGDANLKKLLGDNPAYLAIGTDALWLAFGPKGLEMLKSETMSAAGTAPQLQLGLSASRLSGLIATTDPQKQKTYAKAAEETARDGSLGKDKLSLVIQGGDTLTLRVRFNADFLRFAAKYGQSTGAQP